MQRIHGGGEEESNQVLVQRFDLGDVLEKRARMERNESTMHSGTMLLQNDRKYTSHKSRNFRFGKHVGNKEGLMEGFGRFLYA